MGKATELYLILTELDAGEKTLNEAHDAILRLFSVSESTLRVPDIRNKLTPIVNLIALLQCDEMVDDYIPKEIEQCKISINYLAKRDVYSR